MEEVWGTLRSPRKRGRVPHSDCRLGRSQGLPSEEVISKFSPDKWMNISMKGKEILRGRDVLDRGKNVKCDAISEQYLNITGLHSGEREGTKCRD